MNDTEYKKYGESISIEEHFEKLGRGDADALAYEQSEESQKIKQQIRGLAVEIKQHVFNPLELAVIETYVEPDYKLSPIARVAFGKKSIRELKELLPEIVRAQKSVRQEAFKSLMVELGLMKTVDSYYADLQRTIAGIDIPSDAYKNTSLRGEIEADMTMPQPVGAVKDDDATRIKREALIKMTEIYSGATDALNGKPEKKSVKPHKAKNKIPPMPTRKADALRWVLAWELIKPQIEDDPSLENNFHELREWLIARADKEISQLKEDTLRKIIKRGIVGKIPSRTDFERIKRM